MVVREVCTPFSDDWSRVTYLEAQNSGFKRLFAIEFFVALGGSYA